MGPLEISEVGGHVESAAELLNGITTKRLVEGQPATTQFRQILAALRSISDHLTASFPREHFPIAARAVRRFSGLVVRLVRLFPDDVPGLRQAATELTNVWHLELRPAVFMLQSALAVTPGVYLPEEPSLFSGKDRIYRDIVFEINTTYRNGACNACSVILRRLIESFITAHQAAGTIHLAQNAGGDFYHLEKLITDLQNNNYFGLTRNALDALPTLKRIGDWGAHNRNVLVRKTDLDGLKTESRLCFEELLKHT